MSRGGRPLLSRGDTVGVVATGFAVRPAALAAGVDKLRRMGLRVIRGENVLAGDGYLAGDDETRAADLESMISNPEVRGLWFARGGYGTARILERVPWRRLRSRPRVLIGYSDLTALLCTTVERTGHVCLHGPVVAELGDPTAYHAPSLRKMLAGKSAALRILKRQVVVPGRARGRLIGGNLTVLAHTMGTRFAPSLRGCVLLLEEVGEEAYRVDRALTHLQMAGAFRDLAAVLLGRFEVPATRRRFPRDRAVEEVIRERFVPLGVPVVTGLPVGHVSGKWTLPLGGVAEVDTPAGRILFSP